MMEYLHCYILERAQAHASIQTVLSAHYDLKVLKHLPKSSGQAVEQGVLGAPVVITIKYYKLNLPQIRALIHLTHL